jgi:hypothetical protein
MSRCLGHAEPESLDELDDKVLLLATRQRLVVECGASLRAAMVEVGIQPQAIVASAGTHREEFLGGVDEELVVTCPGVCSQLTSVREFSGETEEKAGVPGAIIVLRRPQGGASNGSEHVAIYVTDHKQDRRHFFGPFRHLPVMSLINYNSTSGALLPVQSGEREPVFFRIVYVHPGIAFRSRRQYVKDLSDHILVEDLRLIGAFGQWHFRGFEGVLQ